MAALAGCCANNRMNGRQRWMCGDQLKGYIMRRQVRNDDDLDWGDDSGGDEGRRNLGVS